MSTIKWAILGGLLVILVIGAIGVGCYFEGRRIERAANQAQLERARTEWAAERLELEQALGNVKDGASRITSGLATAVDLAAGTTDRFARIAILIDGIDAALRGLGLIADQ